MLKGLSGVRRRGDPLGKETREPGRLGDERRLKVARTSLPSDLNAYWQWDPKETAALLSWIIYASFMHLHTRSAWRGERGAWASIVGFASIMFCYLGVNIWISGLHS